MRTIWIVALLVLFSGITLGQSGGKPTAQELVERATSGFKADVRNEDVTLRVRIIDERNRVNERTLRYLTAYGRDDAGDRTLLRFLEPADIRGAGLLNLENPEGEDTQYLYLRSVGKARRIATGSRRDRFIGTDYSIGDTRSENTRQWTYRDPREDTVVVEEEREGRTVSVTYPCWRVAAVPATGADTDYTRRLLWVHRELPIIVKEEMYDSDALWKTRLRWGISTENEVQLPRARFEEMRDHRSHSRTVLEVLERRFNQDLPDSTFTTRELERGR